MPLYPNRLFGLSTNMDNIEEINKYEEISIKEEKKCIIISPKFVELDDAGNIKTLRDKIRSSGITIKI